APDASIAENFIIDRRSEFSRLGFLERPGINRFTGNLIRRFGISGSGWPEHSSGAEHSSGTDHSSGAEHSSGTMIGRGRAQTAASLSGGNLQKLILAREIDQFRDYIVFSEPCWGLDFASEVFIHTEIRALREKGAAIILISTNLDEILELADRIIVMYRGKIAGIFPNETEAVKEKIGACMQGIYAEAIPTPGNR
ncbi:MAG: hypothetical protein FWF29_06435, partial [Treponema sp.]|nr:hypothetical protein [Treponema sp.]